MFYSDEVKGFLQINVTFEKLKISESVNLIIGTACQKYLLCQWWHICSFSLNFFGFIEVQDDWCTVFQSFAFPSHHHLLRPELWVVWRPHCNARNYCFFVQINHSFWNFAHASKVNNINIFYGSWTWMWQNGWIAPPMKFQSWIPHI